MSLSIHYSVISQSYLSHILRDFEILERESGVGRTYVYIGGKVGGRSYVYRTFCLTILPNFGMIFAWQNCENTYVGSLLGECEGRSKSVAPGGPKL